jgi:hypothetical protein
MNADEGMWLLWRDNVERVYPRSSAFICVKVVTRAMRGNE